MNSTDPYYACERPEIAPFIPGGARRVLEIGCGTGGFRDFFGENVEYWGVEPESRAASLAKSKLSKVLFGFVGEVADELPDLYFDLVICNDVIEHMPNHDQFLLDIQSKIRPGGYLLGSVPNIRYVGQMEELLWGKDWEYKDEGVLDRTHLRFFTFKSLQRALEQANFDIVRLEGINPFHKRKGLKGYFSLLSRARFWLYLCLGRDSKHLQFVFVARKLS